MIPFSPMLLGRAEAPPVSPGWSYELKYDGWRAVVEVHATGACIWTRNGYDVTARFPEFAHLHKSLTPCVLDCELVVLDEDGRPRFEWMHRRKRPAATLVAFEQRRAHLQSLVTADVAGVLLSRTFNDGAALLDACETQQLEGIVAKRDRSRYEPGRRSDAWLKIRTQHGLRVIAERMKKAAPVR